MTGHYYMMDDEVVVSVNLQSHYSPLWVPAQNAVSVKPALTKSKSENNVGRTTLKRGGKKEAELSIEYSRRRNQNDPVFNLLWHSFQTGRPVQIAITDRPVDHIYAGGFESWFEVTDFPKVAGSGKEGVTHEIGLAPTDYAENNALIIPVLREPISDAMDPITQTPITPSVFNASHIEQAAALRLPGPDLSGRILDQRSGTCPNQEVLPGMAYHFDGLGSRIYYADKSIGNFSTESFSIAVWVKTTSTAVGNGNGIVYKRSTAAHVNTGYSLLANSGGVLFRVSDGTNTALGSSTPINDGQWHHILAVRDSAVGRLRLYIDGVLRDDRSSGNITDCSSLNFNLGIGALCVGVDSFYHAFEGYLQDLQIAPAAWGLAEAETLFGDREKAEIDGNRSLWLKCNDQHPRKGIDASGSGNDGQKLAIDQSDFHFEGADVPVDDLNENGYGFGEFFVFGDNEGNDQWHGDLGSSSAIEVDGGKIYQIIFHDVERVSGSGGCYLGWMGYAADGQTIVNAVGDPSGFTQHYHAGTNEQPTQPTTFIGYSSGFSNPGSQSSGGTASNPRLFHEDVAFIRPLILANFSNVPGVFRIREIEINEVDNTGAVLNHLATYDAKSQVAWEKVGGGLDSPVVAAYSDDIFPRNESDKKYSTNGKLLSASGPAPKPIALRQANCCEFFGAGDHLAIASLTGSETVVSSGGSAVPTVGPGRVDFSAGTCWDLVLSNGSRYVMSEGKGSLVCDVSGGNHGTLTTVDLATVWTQQNEFFWNAAKGFSHGNNLDPGSAIDNGWSERANGTEPPIAGFEVAFGKPCKTVEWSSSITAGGFAGSRVYGGIVSGNLEAGKTYIWRAKVRANRNLIGSETVTMYYTGSNGLRTLHLNSGRNLADGWLEVIAVSNVANISGTCGPAVFKSSNGAFSSTFKLYIADWQYIEGDSFDGVDHYPTKGIAVNDALVPAKQDSASDSLDNPLLSSPLPGHNGCECSVDFTGGVAFPGSQDLPTDWKPGDALANPAFVRLLTKNGTPTGADRFLRYRQVLTDTKLADVQKFTQSREF